MEIQDYMADRFPNERQKIGVILRNYGYEEETIERTYRMLIAGATGLFSLERDIFVGGDTDDSRLESYANASQQRVGEILRNTIEQRTKVMLDMARVEDMQPSLAERIDLIEADWEKKKHARKGFISSVRRFFRRWFG